MTFNMDWSDPNRPEDCVAISSIDAIRVPSAIRGEREQVGAGFGFYEDLKQTNRMVRHGADDD